LTKPKKGLQLDSTVTISGKTHVERKKSLVPNLNLIEQEMARAIKELSEQGADSESPLLFLDEAHDALFNKQPHKITKRK
jgi:hypothetical protein